MGHPKLVRSNPFSAGGGKREGGRREGGKGTGNGLSCLVSLARPAFLVPPPALASPFPPPASRLTSSGETVYAAQLLRPGDAQYTGGYHLDARQQAGDPFLLHGVRREAHLLGRAGAVDGERDVACAHEDA